MIRVFEKLKQLFTEGKPEVTPAYSEFNATRMQSDRSRICHAPFRSIRFEQRGVVRTCCYNQQVILGRYPEMNLKEIWKSTEAELLREKLSNNDLSHGCQLCQRQLDNREFNTVKLKQYDGLPESDSGYPTILDFSIHNTCNLECVMCHGEFSSSIRKNREKLPPVPMMYDARFVQQLEAFIPHATQFIFAGGEPFLIDLYYDIWERINTLNPTDVNIVTNGTILNDRVKRILNNGRYHITHSMESFKQETYEQIRLNADLDRVLKNMEYFMAYCREKGTEYAINICPVQQNWKEIPDFVRFCNEQQIKLYILNVIYPPKTTLMVLSNTELQKIETYYEKFNFGESNTFEQHNAAQFNDLLARVKGWKEKATEREQQTTAPKTVSLTADLRQIDELFDLMVGKVEMFRDENPEFDRETTEQTLQRIRHYTTVYAGKRITTGKLKEMQNLSTDSIIGIINGSSEQDFDLILRDHILH